MLVGVFSREPESTYKWLINFLLELPDVKDVRPVYINNNSSQNFNDEVAKCSFAILYHSLNRGRINVTNVTDSIYDRELDYLSNTKDREKILVVIDDVDDSSDLERARILQTQPSIGRLAGDLFLFSKAEKACLRSSGSRTNGSIGLQNLNAADTLNEKLTSMKRILKGKRTGGFSYNDNFTGGTDSSFSGNTGAFSGTRNNSLWEVPVSGWIRLHRRRPENLYRYATVRARVFLSIPHICLYRIDSEAL
ncbi:uncharacterized protein LOC128641605 [Bombina bombina]|uniref:uncharacterized protein LOC128641605 n=1 Tax=Bombina bombina TaxID=8345 RepID=UPI00235B0DDE|nr:uncharacterized protein LOC128641605 [Bombina bombina]